MAKLEQGFIGLDDNSLIMQWNVDAYGNPVSIHINNEIQQVSSTHYIIQLAQIPDEYYKVKFVAELIKDYLIEVRNRNEVKNINQYYVDYQHGIVYFHEEMAGRLVRADYYGRGVIFLSDARIFHRNGEGFAVTLDEVLEKSEDAFKLLESTGGLSQAIELLDDKAEEGNKVADRLENFITETQFYGYTIVLSREAFVVRAKEDGNLHNGEMEDLTVDVVVYKGAKNLSAPNLNVRLYSTTNCECEIENQTLTVTHIDVDCIQAQAIIEIDCGDGLIAYRTIEVTKVFDGVSQFNVEMTNAFHSFSATHSGKIEEEQSVTCEFTVTKANEEFKGYVVGIQNVPSGITHNLEKPTENASSVTFTAQSGTSLPDNASISVVFQFNDYVITKTFAFTKSKAGLSAKSLRLAGNQIIHYENPNYEGTPNPLRTSIVAQVTDLSGTPVWSYLEDEEWIVIDGQNGTNLNLYHNDKIWTNKRELTIKCELDSFSDEITLIKIADGAMGLSSYSVILSNESTTLRVGLDGKIPAEEIVNQYTRVTAFKGADQITPTEINIPESNLYKVDINGSTIDLLDVDSSSITVNIPIEIILDNAVVIEKEWSIAKTERGEIGASGSVYTLNVEGGTRSVVYNQLDKNPRPSYSGTFYAHVYENGNDITSKIKSWYWTCQGHLIGTSISNTFTPEIKEKFNDTILNNSVTVTAIYNHTPISYTVPIVVSKDASGLDWVTDWDSKKVLVRDTEVLTPKLFAGSYDKTHDLITGVAIGTDVLNDGQTQGIVGYQNNNISFLLGTDGSLLVGNPFEDFGSGISYNDGQLIINVDDISIAGATVPTWDDLETQLSDHSKEIILTLQSNINDMNNTLNDVTNHVDSILKDGLITELEKVQLDALFETVQQEMNNIKAQYDSVINNPYLLSDVVENLQKHYRNYMDAYDNIIVVYNDIFKEGTVEEIEYDIMDDEYLEADDFSLEIVEPIDEQDILDDEYLQSEDFGLEVIDEVNEVSLDTLITRDGYTVVTLDGDVFIMVTENTLLDFQDAVQVLRNYSAILQQAINEALLTITENRASILINEAREEIEAEIGDVNSALMDLENTMNGDFKSGLIGLQSRAILEERVKQLEIQKSDVDGQYEVLNQSFALDSNTKEVLALAKYDLDTAHDLLIAKINQTIVDNLITESELRTINSMISDYANELQQYSKIAQECNMVIAEKMANLAVEAITDEDVFNKVTNYGALQGLFLKDEKVYINSEYINTRNFKAVTDDGKETFKIDENGEVSITAKSLSITGQSNLATQDYVNTQLENLTNTNVTFTLSNEFQIIPTDESYYPLNEGTYSITVKGYLGSSEETTNFTIGKVNSSSGVVAVVSNINKTIVFTVSPDAPLEDVSGYVDIPITYDGKQFNKRWSWAVSKQGNQATYVTITGEQFFKYKNNYTGTPTPSTITLTANVFNSTETGKWQYNKNGVWTDCGVTTKTLTLSPNDYTLATTQAVFVRYYVDSVFDTYSVTAISDGLNGTDGIDGVNSFFYVRYSANANGYPMTLEPQSDTKYMGTCSTTSETAPSTVGSYKWSLIKGQDGTDGIVGKDGEDGKSSYLHIRYSNDGANFTPNNGEDIGTYIGTYVDFVEADSNNFSDYSWKKFVGDDGTSITSIEERYYLSNSQQALSGGSWQSNAPTWVSGKYIWTKTIFKYSDNTSKETTPICVTGKDGVSGGVNNVDIMYYQSTSSTTLTGGSWNTEAPTWSNTKYVWTKTVTTLTDGSILESNPVCVTGAKGATGAGAKSVRIVSSSQVFKSSDGGLTYSPSNIKLTTILQNATFANWKYSVDAGVNWLSVVSGQDGLTISSNNLTVSKDSPLFEGTSGVVFRVNTTTSSIYDTITISKIKDVDDMQIGITNLYKNTKYIDREQWANIDSWDTTELYNGYTVIKHTGAWQGIYQSNIEMVPYEKYTLSAFVKGDGVATIEAYASDATIYSYNNFTHKQIAPTEWTRISFTFDCEYDSTDGARPRFENSVDGATLQLYGIKFEKGNIATDWSPNPDDFEGAYTVLLTNEAQVIPTDENRKPTESTTFTTKIQVYYGTSEITEYTIGNILDGYGIDVSQDTNTVYFTVNPNTILTQDSGSFTIPITINNKTFEKIFSWSCSKQGMTGKNGEDAIAIILTNENHTFVANHLGSTAEQIIYTDVIAYKGATPVTPTIGTLPTVKGLTLSKSGVRITIKANYGLELADTGSFNIPITVDGQTFTKSFSWTKVKDGQKGEDGQDGVAGMDAKSVNIVASNMVFKSTDGGTTFSPDNIKLTAQYQNLTHSRWQYSIDGGTTWINVYDGNNGGWQGGITSTSDSLTITIPKTCTLFTDTTTSVVFKTISTDENFYDVITITKLYDVADVDFEGIAEDIAQDKIDELDSRLNQQAVFNRLTNNGESQGLFLENGELYVNGEFINSKNFSSVDNSGNQTFLIDENGNVHINANTFSLSGNDVPTTKDVVNMINEYGQAENLLLKPNFNDSSLTNWNYSVISYLSIDTNRKHENSVSLKLNYTGSSNAVMIETSAMSIARYEAGKTYKVGMWIYVEDKTKLKGNLVFSVKGIPTNSTSKTIIDSITLTSSNLVNNKWVQFTFEFTPKVDHTSPSIGINCSSGVVAWVTDFTLQEQGGMSQQQMVEILNGAGDGLYIVDGQALINAEYIQTGTLRADLIRVQTDEQTANLLPFNYVTLTNAINTDSFGVMSKNTADVYLTIDLPIPYGGTTMDTLTTPIGYSKVTLKKGRSYWFVCEYLARWVSDKKYENGVGVSTATTGSKYGIGTGNNMDILLYPSLDRQGFNEGRNLLNNTDGRGVPTAFLGSYVNSGFNLSTNSTYGYFTLSSGDDSSIEHYFRFMNPDPTSRYGFDANATYTFSGYVRGTKEEISIRWEASTDGVSWDVSNRYPIWIASDTEDVYFEYTFTIPSQVRGFYISFQAYGDNTASGTTAVFSKLKLEKSTKATPWCLSPYDQGYTNPVTIEESKPSYILASVYDFNDSVKVDANAIYGRNWTTLISRIDCEHDFTGYLWLNLDGSGFPEQDSGYAHIRRMQLTYAEDSDAPIVLDYLKQINEKKFTLTDGSYFTNTIGIDGIKMQEGNIIMTSESADSNVNINYNCIELKNTQSNEYQYLAMGNNTFEYIETGAGGSSIIIEDKSYGFTASARNPSTRLIDGIFTGIHYGYNFIDKNGATVYGRPDIYRHTNSWDNWALLGEKIEPLGLVRRDDKMNITATGIFITGLNDGTGVTDYPGGSIWHGSVIFSEAMYNVTGNGQIVNIRTGNNSDNINRIYFGNPDTNTIIETKDALMISDKQYGVRQALVNGIQYGDSYTTISTGNNIDIWADRDCSTTTERLWLGAGKNAITITSYGQNTANGYVKYNGNPMYHEGNVYQTLSNAYSGRDVGSSQSLRKIHSYNLYNKSLLNGDSTSSAYGGYWSVLHWGNGTAGSAELAIDWTASGKGFYMRSLRDVDDNWWKWKRIPNSDWNLDSTSDERYKRAISDVSTEDCYNMVKNIELHSYLLLTEEERYRVEKGELDVDELFLQTVTSEGIHHNLQMGVLAQDMLKYGCGTYVVNQDVLRDENGETISDRYGIDAYNYASAILGGLQEEIKVRDEQYEELKKENEDLKARLDRLEQLILKGE